MKRSLLLHSAWGLVALSAYALGLHFSRPDESSAARREALRIAAAGADANMIGAGGKSAADSLKAAATPLDMLRNRPLTVEQISELANSALRDPNPLTRNLAFSKLLESMTPENVQAVMEAMKENRAGGDQWRLFMYAWGGMDPKGMLAHADTLEGDRKARFLSDALPGWASKDPTGAIAWLDTMEEGDAKNRFRSSLVNGLADHDIGVATSYVMDRAQAGDKQAMGYMETVAGEALRKNGAEAATLWGEALPDGPLKGAALDQIAGAYVRENPEAAATWAAKFATADFGARVIEEVGDTWAERDPKSSTAWLDTLPQGAGRSEGTYSALREWTRRDPTAASEYLAAMPQSEAKDSAVSGFARSLAYEDPESAIIWARTITNEQSRVQTLTRAGQAWFRKDPAAAANWVQSANLPAEAQQAVLNPPTDRRRRG